MPPTKLTDFLKELARDGAKLRQYIADPDAYIEASNLSAGHKQLLKGGNLQAIQAEVRKEDPQASVKPYRIFAIS